MRALLPHVPTAQRDTYFLLVALACAASGCGWDSASGAKVVDAGASGTAPGSDTEETASAPETIGFDLTTPSDASTGAETSVTGCETTPLAAGCACTEPADCQGYCVALEAGKRCASACIETCAEGFACVLADVGSSDPVFLCLPRFAKLCQPCEDNLDCQAKGEAEPAVCLDYGAVGRFCGTHCEADAECPEGYACTDATLGDGTATRQCRKTDSTCSCNEVGGVLAMHTRCEVASAAGTCRGDRICGPDGLTACDAPTPSAEVCDGFDNDCDGLDDNLEPATTCTIGNDFGRCEGTPACVAGRASCDGPTPEAERCNGLDDNCDGVPDDGFGDADGDRLADCVDPDADGDGALDTNDNCPNADNPDQADTDGDSDGDACDADDDADGTPDTVDCAPRDAAVAPGALERCNGRDDDCDGTADEGLCDDTVACTTDRCDPDSGECVHVPVDSACDGGQACTDEVCAPGLGCVNAPTTGAACDDGDRCTRGDACFDGVCGGAATEGCCTTDAGCDDGNPCTVDACEVATGRCSHAERVDETPCDADADGCTRDDRCLAGACVAGAPVTCGPETACASETCESTGPNSSRCAAVSAPATKACDDGRFCTVGDRCDGAGRCLGGAPRVCAGSDGGCRLGECDEASDACGVTPAANGSACSDGDGCTQGDACVEGACVPGAPPECASAGDMCNFGVCQALDATRHLCAQTPRPVGTACTPSDFCLVEATCDGAGQCTRGTARDCDAEVGDQCQEGVCESANRRCVRRARDNGIFCDDGDACTLSDACSGGVCAGTGDACVEDQLSLGGTGQVEPAMADLGGGRYAVQWWQSGTSLPQRLRHSDASGSREGEELVIVGLARPATWSARMSANMAGQHVVVDWNGPYVLRTGGCGTTQTLNAEAPMRGTLFEAEGTLATQGSLWSATLIARLTSTATCIGTAQFTGQRVATLAFANGSFGHVGSARGDVSPGSAIGPAPERVWYHPPTGFNTVGPRVTLVAETATTGEFDARMTRNGSNRFLAAWVAESGLAIEAARFDLAGAREGAAPWVLVTHSAGQTISKVRVGTFESGRFVLLWEAAQVDGSGLGVFLRRFDTDGAPLGEIVTVSTQRTGAQGLGDVGVFGDDGFVVVFDDANGDGSGYAVKAQRYSEIGAPLGANLTVNRLTAGAQSRPAVQVLGGDDWVVAFVDDQSRVWTRRFAKDGVTLPGSPERRANQATLGAQRYAAAARAPSGEVMLVWEGPSVAGGTEIFGRIVDDAGEPLGPERRLNETDAGDQGQPRVAATATGFVVVWHSAGQDGSGLGVYARAFDLAGRPRAGELRVAAQTAGDQHRPSIAAMGDACVVSWTGVSGGNADVYAAVIGADGALRRAELRVNATTQFAQDRSAVAAVGASSVLVAWESMAEDADGLGVFGRILSADGTLGPPARLNGITTSDQAGPAVAARRDGTQLLACWESLGQEGTGGWGVRCQRYALPAITPVGSELAPSVVTAGDQLRPAVAALADGGYVVAWDTPGVDAAGLAVQIRHYAPDGSPKRRIVANRTSAGDQSRPFLLTGPGDACLVGWQSASQDGSDLGVYFRVLERP